MKKIILVLLVCLTMQSCSLYSSPPLGETKFPLKRVLSLPTEKNVHGIAIGETWIAFYTDDSIIAMNLDMREKLWTTKMKVQDYGDSFRMIKNKLIAVSEDQILLIDKDGYRKEISLDLIEAPVSIIKTQDPNNIIKVMSIYTDYIYVVRGSSWILEAYNISKNTIMWKLPVGRGIGNVLYDSSSDVVYLITDDSIRAFENLSGRLLWEMNGTFGKSAFDSGILYVREASKDQNTYKMVAIDVHSQKELWMKNITIPQNDGVYDLTGLSPKNKLSTGFLVG